MHGRLVAALLALATGLAGCLQGAGPAGSTRAEGWSVEVPVDVNVVLVGFGDRLDPARLLADLPATREQIFVSEFRRQRAVHLEPVQMRLAWHAHHAPAAFAEAFFQAAMDASFEGPAPAFLVDYDRTSGQRRFDHPPVPLTPLDMTPLRGLVPEPTMRYIDAPTLEAWVEANLAAHGLAFPGAQYTMLVVDSYTEGFLPRDGYHYYYFDDGTIDADLDQPRPTRPLAELAAIDEFHTPKDPTSNRGWGGAHGFAWLDVGAAPSWLDNQPWVPAFEDDNVDHPVWDLEGQDAKLHRNLNRHLADMAYVKLLRTPIYDYGGEDAWAFPVQVFVDQAAVSGAATPVWGVDVQRWLGADRVAGAFRHLAPWMDVKVDVQYRLLPQDDPGMADAVRRAKAYGNPTVVSSEVIEDHVRRNWADYVPQFPAGTRVIPQFLFYFDGTWTFWGPNQGGGYATDDGWGRAWAAFNHIFDVCVKTEQVPCTKASKWRGDGSMDLLVIHEGGHHVGLHHARDTSVLEADRESTSYRANWFWDSVHSVMTYRHQNPAFDRFDQDQVARTHAGWAVGRLAALAPALRAAGEGAPAAQAEAALADGERLLREGRWQDAASRAVLAWRGLRDHEPLVATAALDVLPTEAESFGDRTLFPASPGLGGLAPNPFPQDSPLRAWRTMPFEVREGAAYLHVALRDRQQEGGALRSALVAVMGPDGKYAGGAFGSVWDESFITRLRGPGAYEAWLVTDGGLAGDYEVTLDVNYPA